MIAFSWVVKMIIQCDVDGSVRNMRWDSWENHKKNLDDAAIRNKSIMTLSDQQTAAVASEVFLRIFIENGWDIFF
jgi:hypothetical protein